MNAGPWWCKANPKGEVACSQAATNLVDPARGLLLRINYKHQPNCIAAPLFSNGRPVPKDDNVVLYLHYAVKVNGKTEIVQITSVEKEDGHRIESTKKKESARFRGNILIYDQQSQTLSQPIAAVVTNWLSVETIIDEVVVEEDDKLKLSDDSIIMLKAFKDDSTKKSTKGKKNLPKGYFEVEDILQERICPKTHEREYLVKYKGYGEEDNEWLPGSTFLGPVAFQTKSRSGRIRKHVTNHDIEEPLPLSPVGRIPEASFTKPGLNLVLA